MRFLLVIFFALCALGCGKSKAMEKTYAMHGKVLSTDEGNHLAKIEAGQIGNWMSPMTMEYLVPNAADWQQMKTGVTFDATVHVQGDEFWVAGVHPTR